MSDKKFAIHTRIVDDKFVVTIHAPRMSTLNDIAIEYGTPPTHDIYRGEDCIIITSDVMEWRYDTPLLLTLGDS